jgi:8-amino-3,8-dideoxy-alpha-D-manno-octulosonate transaminase
LSQKAHKALGESGVDACFYWFVNNWHYINGWEHLRDLKGMGNIPSEIKNQMQDLNNTDFSKSDAWMGRAISSLVKIGWTEAQTQERAATMKRVIQSLL